MGITHGWTSGAAPDGSAVTPSNFNDHTADVLAPSGLTGATTATRYVGGTASVAPTAGTFSTGDYVVTQSGSVYICTAGGSPGTWGAIGGAVPAPVSAAALITAYSLFR